MTPLLLATLAISAFADEGMWLPDQLPALQEDLTAYGVKTPGAQLARLDVNPLAAIADLGNCSGAFVSKDGLVATAYHCIGTALEHASEPGENLFENGFHARERGDERWAGPGVKIRVTTSMNDVTADVLNGTKKLTGEARAAKIESNRNALVRKCQNADEVHCEVVAFDSGSSWRLIEQTEFGDVRVVYAPPQDVGYFGGDADNWQWPRHSGDFAFLRVYGTPTKRPARYRSDNVPYPHPNFLPVATKPPAPGSFVMVAGFPARTFRWRSAAELNFAATEQYPTEIATGRAVIALFDQLSAQDDAIASKVGPRRLAIQNRTQYLEGNLEMFARVEAVARKWELERDLSTWIVSDASRQTRWGSAIDDTRRLEAEEGKLFQRDYLARELRRNVKLFDAALRLVKLAEESKKRDADRSPGFQNRDRPAFAEKLDAVDDGFDFRVDQAMMALLLERALSLPTGTRIPELDAWFDRFGGKGTREQRIQEAVRKLYTQGAELADRDRRRALMDTSGWYLQRTGNPWFELGAALHPFYERLEAQQRAREIQWSTVRPVYLDALREFLPTARPRVTTTGKVRPGLFYPDANRSLRVTIGKVDGYFPRDALIAAPQSRLEGIIEKLPTDGFTAPQTLVDAIKDRRYGPYTDPKLGSVPVNFLSTADTTLGSSGSATIDAEGRFIGVLFDGNFESMATDWIFDEGLIRSIHTDVSYILWVLDAVAGADALLTELGVTPSIDNTTAAAKVD